MKKMRGFTLVELLVVISVISILVGVVLPRFKGMQDEANKAKSKAELKTLQTAVESYFINQNPQQYPPSTDALCEEVLNISTPKIVATPLYDPFGAAGDEYVYARSPSGTYYVILSVGPNGEPNISGIGDDGILTGDDIDDVDDIHVTNGTGWS